MRGTALDVVSAWKDVLLALGAPARRGARAAGRSASTPRSSTGSRSRYGALVVLYGDPAAALARRRRHAPRRRARRPPRPAAGRRVLLRPRPRPDRARRARLGVTILASACGRRRLRADRHLRDPALVVAALGAPGWFTNQLGFTYNGLSRPAGELRLQHRQRRRLRRLVSMFLSPLAASYMFVVALLFIPHAASAAGLPLALLLFAGLSVDALALCAARARGSGSCCARSCGAQCAARWSRVGVVVVVGLAFVKAYPHIGPRTSFTRDGAAGAGANAASIRRPRRRGRVNEPRGASTSAISSLRDGIETVLRHPQGYGPGNAGSTAARTDVQIKAGESTYTELGVDDGPPRGAALRRLVARAVALGRPPPPVAQCRLRRDARARAADRHHRRAVGRGRVWALAGGAA